MLARTVVGLIALLLMAVAYFVMGHELCDSARVLWHGTPWKLLLEALDPGLLQPKTGTGGASGFIHSVPLYSSLSYWEERTLFSCGLVPTGCALMHHLCAAAGVRHRHRRQLPLPFGRRVSFLAEGVKRDSEEAHLLKTVASGGPWHSEVQGEEALLTRLKDWAKSPPEWARPEVVTLRGAKWGGPVDQAPPLGQNAAGSPGRPWLRTFYVRVRP